MPPPPLMDARMPLARFTLIVATCCVGAFGLGYLLASKFLDDALHHWN